VRPYSIAVPAALAMAERIGAVNGRDYIVAIAAAVDVTVRIGLAAPLTTLRWSRPSTLGTFGAAVAGAKLLALDGARTLDALGIAYSQAAGNTQAMMDRALIKRVQPGFAARAGVTAAILAQRGVTGAANALEGQNGYFNLYEGGRYDRQRITERLGTYNYAGEVAFKPYPCAAEVHGVIDATLALVREHDIQTDRVTAIRISVPPLVYDLGGRPYPPENGSSLGAALASVRYGAATAIVHRAVGLANYTDTAVVDPRVLALIERIEVESSNVTGASYFTPATVEIATNDAQACSKTVSIVHGHADDPLQWPEIVDKFRTCASCAAPPVDVARQDRVIALVEMLEHVPDVGEIARLLAAPS
jgi:2-methylcitrate dehydratase PrpD